MKIKLKENIFERPHGKAESVYTPIIPVFLTYNHAPGRSIESHVDTGASISLFPSDYAKKFFNFTDSKIKKGRETHLTGIAGLSRKAYGFKCSIHHPEFRIKDTYVYFLDNQPYPLLGFKGFIDQFESICIRGKEKTLELTK